MAKTKKTKKQPPKPRNPMARELGSPLYRPRIVKKKTRRDVKEEAENLVTLLDPED